MLSEILTKLEASEQALFQELEGVDLNHSPSPESWSGGQVLAHLIKTVIQNADDIGVAQRRHNLKFTRQGQPQAE